MEISIAVENLPRWLFEKTGAVAVAVAAAPPWTALIERN
jgi:hypothetical protein